MKVLCGKLLCVRSAEISLPIHIKVDVLVRPEIRKDSQVTAIVNTGMGSRKPIGDIGNVKNL